MSKLVVQPLLGQTALITGSSKGIGKEIARRLAQAGARVLINGGHDMDALHDTEMEFTNAGFACKAYAADVSDYSSVKRLFYNILSDNFFVDILVNNAAISHVGLFSDTTYEEWQAIINTNLISVISCTHRVIPYMLRCKSGSIINISSIWGSRGASCEALYAATKGGVEAFTRSLAKELAPSGIRVNAIACGAVDTDMNMWLTAEEREFFVAQIPAGRFADAVEVAELALFLACNKSSYINGQVIGLDGAL